MNELGVETLDADDIVHELIPDPEERRRIAAEVFSDPEKRRALEAKIHPLVKERVERFLDPRTSESNNLKIAVIPLLFEARWEKNFDIICCVVSTRENQVKRMVATRGMTCAEAEARLAAQLPVEEKAKRSHYVIHNDGKPEELKAEASAFLGWLKSKEPLKTLA